MIHGFAFLLTLLLIWLLGFILSDIEDWPGPDYDEIVNRYVDSALFHHLDEFKEERDNLEKRITDQREIQELLRNSTENSQQTMGQLLAMQKLSLEKGVTPTQTEQDSLAESEARFLENQKRFQEANERITALSEEQRGVAERIQLTEKEIEEKRKPAQDEYNHLRRKHELQLAALKLLFLVPLLLAAAWFSIKWRSSAYALLFQSGLVAAFWQTGVVMHEHFPSELFKYVALGAAVAIVLAFLVHLIRMVAAPRKDWLLKQYKEAYNKRLCPLCDYPIERGPYKHLTWTRKGPRGFLPSSGDCSGAGEEPYTCPACGEQLYEKCDRCGQSRHSLLPYCQGCGHEKRLEGTGEAKAHP